jgi:subtilase family serine protease
MERILLQLSSSPEQEAALAQLLAEQQDPASPRFHQWLSPEQFGEQFGAAPEDIATIVAWLEPRVSR